MTLIRFRRSRGVMMSSAAVMGMAVGTASAQWPQWGGPNRNFTAETADLAEQWPDAGPPKLWSRELGDGYSSIVVDDGVLYTMYRKGKTPFEYTVALDAGSGKAIWEAKHTSPVPREAQEHPGPHSTPLIVGDRLFTVGRNAVLRCYDKGKGEVVWTHDLVGDYGAVFSEWGYAASPIAYQNLVILPVGRKRPDFGNAVRVERPPGQPGQPPDASGAGRGRVHEQAEGRTLMAFSQEDGRLVWKSNDFGTDHSSPIIIDVGGRAHLVMLTPETLFAVNPADGALLWETRFERGDGCMTTPVWLPGGMLCVSTPEAGSRAYRISTGGAPSAPEAVWQTQKMRMTFTNPVLIGDYIVGSSGAQTATLMCLDARTGERVWVHRDIGTATLVAAGGKLIILQETGELVLATLRPDGLTVHSKCKMLDRESFTAPTLVGETLYVRDRRHIMALNVG